MLRRKALRGTAKVVAPLALLLAGLLGQVSDASATINNSASASGTYNAATVTSNTATATVPVAAGNAQIGLVKQAGSVVDANGNGLTDVNDTLSYTFTVYNLGNVTLNGITITDPKVSPVTCAATTLAPGANTTCSAPAYALTQADIDAGSVSNTAVANATGANGTSVSDNSDPVAPGPASAPTVKTLTTVGQMQVVKSTTFSGPAVAGTVIHYTFAITNTGPTTLTNITLSDPSATVTGGPSIASLAPGASNTSTFAADHTITPAEVSAGSYTNTATATGHKMPSGTNVVATGSVTTPLNYSAAMSFSKSGALAVPGPAPKANDIVNYQLVVTNTGNVPLTNVTISDPQLASNETLLQRNIALLDGAQNPQADSFATASIDAGGLAHGGAASAQRAVLHAAHDLPQAQADLVTQRALVRMSGANGPLQAGEKIGFLYTLTNTGDLPLTGITIAQPDGTAFGSDLSLLNPNVTDGASIIFTRQLTDADLASGAVKARAYVLAHARGREMLQQLDAGLPLSSIRSYDSIATAAITPSTPVSIPVGQSFTFTGTHALSQAEIDAGVVNNTAQANATDPLGNSLAPVAASASVPLARAPKVGVVKTATLAMANGVSPQVNDVITYHFAVTNLGNVTLSAVTVQDAPLTMTGAPIALLAPGVTDTSYTAQHLLTQADLDAGKYDNQATVDATSPLGALPQVLSDFADPNQHRKTTVLLAPKASIALLKQVAGVTTHPNGLVMKDDVITYKFTVTNTGNLTLNNVHITDPLMPGAPNVISGGPLNNFAPGAIDTGTFTGTYTITQADVDRGHVDNTATVTGTPPFGPDVHDDSDPGVITGNDPTIEPIPQVPQIALFKTIDPTKNVGWTDANNDNIIDAGDKLKYTFQVQNLGNVTLNNLVLTDAGTTVVNTNPGLNLLPNSFDGSTFTAIHTVTLADEAAGLVQNSARIDALQINGGGSTFANSQNGVIGNANPGTTNTPVQQTPTIGVVLSPPSWADTNGDGIVNAGDTLTYPVKVKNTGGVPLSGIIVSKITTDLNVLGAVAGTLAPNAEDTTSVTATHVLTPADVTAGFYDAQIKAEGTTTPGSLVVRDNSDALDYALNAPTRFVIGASPAIAVLKTYHHFENAAGATVATPVSGGKVIYAVSVKNTGNVNFTDVTLAEVPGFTGTVIGSHPFALAAGATDSTHFTVSQPISNADILAGSISNQLTATGLNAVRGDSAPDLSDPSSLTGSSATIVPLTALPGIAVIKTATVEDVNGNGANDTDDIIHYAFTVVNTGNVDLTNVTLTDTNAALSGGPIPLLAVGQSNTTAYTASYTVTAPDVAAGHYDNQATASGIWNPANPLVDVVTGDSDFASLTANPKRPTVVQLSLAKPVLTKTAARSQVKRGEVVPYTITAMNLGAGPFTLADIMPPGFGYVPGSATVNGVATAPAVINGQTLTFTPLSPVTGKITLKLNLLASTTLSGGKFINNARLIDPSTGQVIAVAQATVEVMPEAVFDCSDIIGRVFDDLNGDGYMNDGEPGLPGVRLATVNGVLITTDASGKYHVPCAAIPDAAIGSNFLLKLDPRTLPTGYKVTSENPRDVRVTRGKVTVLNFGAAKLHQVKVDLTGKAFDAGTADLTERWSLGVDKLVKILKKRKSSLLIVYHQDGESDEMAQARAAAVAALVAEAWDAAGKEYALSILTDVEAGK